MEFNKNQKIAIGVVGGLLGLSWYVGNQFEKADMMRAETFEANEICHRSCYDGHEWRLSGTSHLGDYTPDGKPILNWRCDSCGQSKSSPEKPSSKADIHAWEMTRTKNWGDGVFTIYAECKRCGVKGYADGDVEESIDVQHPSLRAETFEAQGYGEISASKIKELEKYIKKGGQALDYHELPYHIQRELEILIDAENGLEDSYGELFEFINDFSKMGNDYVTEEGKKYIENHMTIYHAEEYVAETMTPSEVRVEVTKDVTPKGSKIIVEECVDIQAKKADTTSNFYRVRFRDPSEMSNFRVPAWAARAANTMGSKYYDVAGSKVTMGQDKSGNWKIQSVMIPKRANVDVNLALKIANHIQDRLEKEGKWAPKKCQDNERVLVIR